MSNPPSPDTASPSSPKSDASLSPEDVRKLVVDHEILAANIAPEKWLEDRLRGYRGGNSILMYLIHEIAHVKQERARWLEFMGDIRKAFDEYKEGGQVERNTVWEFTGNNAERVVVDLLDLVKELDQC